jgi:hypothetical protein
MNTDTSADLADLDNKFELVRDRVRAVVGNYQTGLYLCGAGGLGKSYNVFKQLEELQADFRVFNSRMTGKGLFRALEKAPHAVHVLEDMERLVNDKDAQGVLRSALWAQPGQDRVVTWVTAEAEARFVFHGGIIMLANRPLSDHPELRALATRIAVHKLEISDAEMAAHMLTASGRAPSISGTRCPSSPARSGWRRTGGPSRQSAPRPTTPKSGCGCGESGPERARRAYRCIPGSEK